MKVPDTRQMELACADHDSGEASATTQSADDDLMRRIDKVIGDTVCNVRPYLNRMVKDVERLLEGSFIRTPSSNVLDDMIEGLEKDIRKFVNEVRALKRWSQPHPPRSSTNHFR
ncbi:MAG: hypothetical protein C4532_08405 [Candidatus Abyssobacteria bacterium SURF_17]|uniref:Uncharacterized protein n=1 Tax=Candidatus Abyssobacteria bacterium SURF_17 TaxID=2093361 RepID=A0A419EZQ8_9BACT|nr:MAG: hypothetical protein C4532_08405 [Candidatus Abyssubacteria bacterium SURF_17]